jgi:hypothetical protein
VRKVAAKPAAVKSGRAARCSANWATCARCSAGVPAPAVSGVRGLGVPPARTTEETSMKATDQSAAKPISASGRPAPSHGWAPSGPSRRSIAKTRCASALRKAGPAAGRA